MTVLTKIGNSQGVRIPKSIIKQAHLENMQIEFEVVENGLLLKPISKNSRELWEGNINQVIEQNKNQKDEGICDDMLNDSDLEVYQW